MRVNTGVFLSELLQREHLLLLGKLGQIEAHSGHSRNMDKACLGEKKACRAEFGLLDPTVPESRHF